MSSKGGVSSLTRSTSIMVVLTLGASATNYASNLVFGRLLTPASFGDLTALLALAVILATPTSAAQTVMAERVAAHVATGDEARLRYLIRHASAHVGVISMAVGAVYAAAIPLVIGILGLQAPGPAIALVPFIVLSYFWPYALGILQGFERFVAYGALMLGAAVMRIAFGVPWVLAGGGAGGAIAGQALGVLIGVLFIVWSLRHWRLARGSGAATRGVRRRLDSRATSATLAFVAFAVLSNFDIILAKLWLTHGQAGSYAALVTVEKMVLFLPAAVSVTMVPAAARAQAAGESPTRILRISMLLVAATTLVVVIPALVAPHLLMSTMFGSRYADAVPGIRPIALAGAGLAAIYLLVTYTVAMSHRRWSILLVAGVPLQALAISVWHGSPNQVAVAQAGVVCAVLVLNEVLFHPLLRHRPRA